MATTLRILNDSHPDQGMIKVNNPPHIPRVGDRIEWNYTPAPTVSHVLWEFKEHDIEITVLVR